MVAEYIVVDGEMYGYQYPIKEREKFRNSICRKKNLNRRVSYSGWVGVDKAIISQCNFDARIPFFSKMIIFSVD